MPNKTTTATKAVNPLFRSSPIEKRQFDEETREIEVKFSSEAPVERFFGSEILDHGPESNIRTERLEATRVVLWGHDTDELIGNITEFEFDRDAREGRATIKLGRAGKAAEIADNIASGIYPNVSVGYRIFKAIDDEENEEYRVTDWEPFEVSLVSIPADITATVRRSFETNPLEVKTMPDKIEPTGDDKTTDNVVDLDQIRSEESERIYGEASKILALGKSAGQEAAAAEWISERKSLDSFRDYCIEHFDDKKRDGAPEDLTDSPAHLDMSPNDVNKYSIVRALNAQITGNWKRAGLELECSQLIEDRIGRDAKGIFMPVDIQRAPINPLLANRAPPMGVAKVGEGAELVPVIHMGSEFIEYLYASSAVLPRARILNNLTGNVNMPKQASSAAHNWMADDESGASEESLTTATVSLVLKILAGAVGMTRALLKQSDPSVEAMVRADLARGAALGIDLGAMEGSGSGGAPLGIVNSPGVNTQDTSGTGAAPTFPQLVGFETAVAVDNALMGSLAYVMHPTMVGYGKTTAKDAGSGIMLIENNMLNGYPVVTSTQIAATRIIFGNFADLIIGFWGVLDIQADTATHVSSGGLVLRSFLDADCVVRHGESFCINNNVA